MAVLGGAGPLAAQSLAAPAPTPDMPPTVRDAPCAADMAEGFRCVTLRMPLDHFHDTGRTIDVTYAVRRHTGPGRGRGTFVTLTGGPGTSGIQSAVSYTDGFAESIQRRYDIVFLDQRGAHLSGDMTCPDAALAFYRSESDPATSTATTGLGADAKAFVDDCISELGVDPTILPYLGTRQAVEDLEAIRTHLDAERLMLYGESYGTQYAQLYAAAHPERLAGLFLDGPVDLSRGLFDYYEEQTQGFEQALEGTLYDCTTARPCTADDLAPNSLAGWDGLADRLAEGPLPFEFHGSTGSSERREFSRSDLDNAASAFLYSEHDRMLLQRGLTAASQEDLWYLSRLLYSGLVMDPETQQAIPDPSYSDGLYYAVECLDYAIPGDTPEERATAYLNSGRQLGVDSLRMGALFYGDLPCAWWPAQPETVDRPPLVVEVPFPMFVLGATLDPATPWANGERIAASAGGNAWVIVKPGGPHVIFGRGEACPDDLVTAFLVRGAVPKEPRTVCPGNVADDYVRLPPLIATAYRDTRAALRSADIEIVNSVDYWFWDAEEPLEAGCRFGGTIRYTPSDTGARLRLDACSWSSGLALTGTGVSMTTRARSRSTSGRMARVATASATGGIPRASCTWTASSRCSGRREARERGLDHRRRVGERRPHGAGRPTAPAWRDRRQRRALSGGWRQGRQPGVRGGTVRGPHPLRGRRGRRRHGGRGARGAALVGRRCERRRAAARRGHRGRVHHRGPQRREPDRGGLRSEREARWTGRGSGLAEDSTRPLGAWS